MVLEKSQPSITSFTLTKCQSPTDIRRSSLFCLSTKVCLYSIYDRRRANDGTHKLLGLNLYFIHLIFCRNGISIRYKAYQQAYIFKPKSELSRFVSLLFIFSLAFNFVLLVAQILLSLLLFAVVYHPSIQHKLEIRIFGRRRR